MKKTQQTIKISLSNLEGCIIPFLYATGVLNDDEDVKSLHIKGLSPEVSKDGTMTVSLDLNISAPEQGKLL